MSRTRSSRHSLRTRRLPSGGTTLLCAGQGLQLPVVSAFCRLTSSGGLQEADTKWGSSCVAQLHVLFCCKWV